MARVYKNLHEPTVYMKWHHDIWQWNFYRYFTHFGKDLKQVVITHVMEQKYFFKYDDIPYFMFFVVNMQRVKNWPVKANLFLRNLIVRFVLVKANRMHSLYENAYLTKRDLMRLTSHPHNFTTEHHHVLNLGDSPIRRCHNHSCSLIRYHTVFDVDVKEQPFYYRN